MRDWRLGWIFSAMLQLSTGPAYAGEPPDLEAKLIAAGWLITPEQSATYAPGDIYTRHQNAPVVFRKDCFDGDPREGEYTSLEVVQALKLGARFPLGVARFKLDGMQYKQLRYASPYVAEFSEMTLVPSSECRDFLQKRDDLADLYVIQSVLSAEVTEQLCRSMDGRVGIAGFRVEGGLKQECNQGSEGHVAVAYKTIPLSLLLHRTEGVRSDAETAFEGVELDVEARLKLKQCQVTAEQSATRAREGLVQERIRAAQTDAGQAWSSLAVKLERCAGLSVTDRVPCAQALTRWIEVAKSLTVHMEPVVEHVPTPCGLQVVAFPSATHDVHVPELAMAESAERTFGAIVGDGSDSNNETITITVTALDQNVDKLVVICQGARPQQGTGPLTISDVEIGICRVQGFSGLSALSATLKTERSGRYGCFRNSTDECEWLGN